MDALKVEESDRRFTVIKTDGNLTHTNFLHYGSYEQLYHPPFTNYGIRIA